MSELYCPMDYHHCPWKNEKDWCVPAAFDCMESKNEYETKYTDKFKQAAAKVAAEHEHLRVPIPK